MKTDNSNSWEDQSARKLIGILLILVALSISLIYAGVAVYGYFFGSIGDAKIDRVRGDISTLTSALRIYGMLNRNLLPSNEQGLNALVSKPPGEPLPPNWKQLMKKLPLDPWGKNYHYRNPGEHNPHWVDLFSLGKDGIESDDDVGNWED